MNPLPTSALPSVYQFECLLGVEMPPPALERGWLHSRELFLEWDIARIIAAMGDGCWFSHYCRDSRDPGEDHTKMRPWAIAGFWPAGGFVELRLRNTNPLDDHPRGMLIVYAATSAQAEALMTELLTQYRHDVSAVATQARIGLLNYSGDCLGVERIHITAEQTVPRERVDLYYGDGTAAWLEEWTQALTLRRYGLTILTGAPGTGKTTLLRSLAQWLAASHKFYFMPAARFASVEAGELVTFWAGENRNSKQRKVLILEDAESVLLLRGQDNREKVATLLNLTDGMMGDALGLHIVCTLNSDLTEIDPALLRPGRLIAHRDFDLLTADEARRLASALGRPEPTTETTSLAEFFVPPTTGVVPPPSRRKSLGFHTLLSTQT